MRVRTGAVKPPIYSSPWFLIPKPNPQARFRLFCFPYAGGLAEIYYSWTDYLPEEVELVAIQYPGHIQGARKKLHTRLSLLVDELLSELNYLLDKNYALFGHSMGALTAYELARIIAAGELKQPDYLFFSARNPPHLRAVQPFIHKMANDEYIQVLRAFKVVPDEVFQHKGLMQIVLPILKADFEMIETFEYNPATPPLDVPVCAFAGTDDNLAPPLDMAKWQRYTSLDFKLVTFPEKHYFILNEAVRKSVINNIIQCIDHPPVRGVEIRTTVQ